MIVVYAQLLFEPIFLPCGETVCKAHSEYISKNQCQSCSETHPIPKHGFLINKIVQGLLEKQYNTLGYNFSQFNDSKKLIQELNRGLKDIELMCNDPSYYISEYFTELNRQVDHRRDTIIQETERYSSELIQKMAVLHQECLATATTTKTKLAEGIDGCKVKLEELNEMLTHSK